MKTRNGKLRKTDGAIVVFFFLCAVGWLFQATAQAEESLEECRTMWKAGRYEEAAPLLIRYRYAGEYGKNPEVDYMIATSLCRIPGQEEKGRRFFNWISANYSLDETSRSLVEREMRECAPNREPLSIVAFHTQRSGSGVVGVRGKTYYWLNAENAPLASAPARVVREIPIDELRGRLFKAAEGEEAARRARELAGQNFQVLHVGHFVLASASRHDTDNLKRIGGELQKVLLYYVSEFQMAEPDHLITVYLVPDTHELRRLAEKLHGLKVSDTSIGYSHRDDLSMIGVIPGRYTGTLRHELFHLLVRNNFGDIPPWMDEGMAALYEVSRIDGDRVVGMPNWRGAVLQKFWDGRPGIEKLVAMDWRSFDEPEQDDFARQQAANHAMARYFVLYLQDAGLLGKVYEAFRARKVEETMESPGKNAVVTLEASLGKKAGDLDGEFSRWFQDLQEGITALENRQALIKQVQERLKNAGYDPGPVDGHMGANTRDAIRRLQGARGLTTTGDLDAATLKLLGVK